jgi:pyruvate-formate lyase-activating enzyme
MRCDICEIGCEIERGGFGRCKMYINENNKIVERFPDRYLAVFPISIETMPMLHLYPNGKFLQICTVGCNFKCGGCISEILINQVGAASGILKEMKPEQIIKRAIAEDCKGIAFCMNDPIVSYYTFKDLAAVAKDNSLLVGCSTNAYFTEVSLKALMPYLDFVNIGIKGYSDAMYKLCGAQSSKPVLRNLKLLYDNNVHVEVAAMYRKGFEVEVMNTAEYISSISKDIPFQIMRFIPFGEANIELEPTIRESEILCDEVKKYLNYVYLFNSPGTNYLNTICPKCGKVIFKRDFFGPMGSRIIENKFEGVCECGYKIPFMGTISDERFDEPGFFGGYRYTRALEMIHAILVTLRVDGEETVGEIWFDVIRTDYLGELHEKVQRIDSYLGIVKYLAERTGKEREKSEFIDYIKEKIDFFTLKVKNAERPGVYYSMGYPLFALNAGRLENNLVEAAGGISVNKLIKKEGKPGINISKDEFIGLNPEVIFISGFLSCPVSDFHEYCMKNGLNVDAVKNKRIYRLYPGWDFGNPRWVLGLMYIANKVHPEIFNFNMEKEAEEFYRRFYGAKFSSIKENRSFYIQA